MFIHHARYTLGFDEAVSIICSFAFLSQVLLSHFVTKSIKYSIPANDRVHHIAKIGLTLFYPEC